MGKKSRASRRTSRTVPTSATPRAPNSVSTSARPFDRDFSPDYAPVIMDLKRIGTLAGTFFVLLIVLSFFLK